MQSCNFNVVIGTFIDTYRILLFGAILFLLIALSYYSFYVGSMNNRVVKEQLSNCLTLNGPCSEKTITLVARIHAIENGTVTVHFRTQRGGRSEDLFDRKHPVLINNGQIPLSIGTIAALKGRFLSSHQFQLQAYQTERKWVRAIKYGISLLGLFATMAIWFFTFQFSFTAFQFSKKRIDSNA